MNTHTVIFIIFTDKIRSSDRYQYKFQGTLRLTPRKSPECLAVYITKCMLHAAWLLAVNFDTFVELRANFE